MKKIFKFILGSFALFFLSSCVDMNDVAKKDVEIKYKTVETVVQDGIEKEELVEKEKVISLDQLNEEFYIYSSIKIKLNDVDELDSSCGFDITFVAEENKEVNFNFEISNGITSLYDEEIILKNKQTFEFFNDTLKISLKAESNIIFNFYNLEDSIKVYDIIILGKDEEIDDERLFDDEEIEEENEEK